MSVDPQVFVHEWNVREFYHLVRYRAWRGNAQNEYQKLIANKK